MQYNLESDYKQVRTILFIFLSALMGKHNHYSHPGRQSKCRTVWYLCNPAFSYLQANCRLDYTYMYTAIRTEIIGGPKAWRMGNCWCQAPPPSGVIFEEEKEWAICKLWQIVIGPRLQNFTLICCFLTLRRAWENVDC